MKLQGIAGQGSGKLGSHVYASVAGEQIVRTYQPSISNPNTALQVNQRARMKLMSQLSTVFAPVIVIKRHKLQSARNLWVKKNIALSSGNDGEAIISLENIQLTSGSAGLPGIHVERVSDTLAEVELVANAAAAVDRVVYITYKKNGAAKLQLIGSVIAETAGADGKFTTFAPIATGDIIVYAYGIKDLNQSASAAYNDYEVASGEDIAKLLMARTTSMNDYRFTKTRGCQILAAETESQSVGGNQSRVFLTASGAGSVSGNGIYNNGETVTITATPEAGSIFIGWLNNGSGRFVAVAPTFSFEANGLVDLIAVFQNPQSSTAGLNGKVLPQILPEGATVVIDGNAVDVSLGLVRLDTTFDNIHVDINDNDAIITYVPEGSALGDTDNYTFDKEGQNHYTMTITETGAGCIYYNGLVWFYIEEGAWENPYADATIRVDNNAVTVAETINIEADPDFVYVSGLPEGAAVTMKSDGVNVPVVFQENAWVNENTGLTAPIEIYVDNALWVTLKIGGWVNPYPDAVIKINDSTVAISSEEVNFNDGVENIVITNIPSDLSLKANSNSQGLRDFTYFSQLNTYEMDHRVWGSEVISKPIEIYIGENLWFTIVEQ